MGRVLSRDDLDELSESAAGVADPVAIAAELVAAAAGGRLADPGDTGYAYLLAAEIHERVDELPEALALTERALAAYGDSVGESEGDPARTRAYHARLLLQLGHAREGMAELAELPPDPYEDEDGDEDSGGGEVAELVTDEYGLAGDPPEVADAVLLIWPEAAYELVDQRWPEVLEPTGAESWEDYRRYCQAVIAGWPKRSSLLRVAGDADEFGEWLAEQGADPYGADLVALARGYADYLAEETEPLELPPGPRDPCWCGAPVSYAQCCQQLSPPP